MMVFALAGCEPAAFESADFRNQSGARLRYRLFTPASDSPRAKYPLIVWLHDILALGIDNRRQTSGSDKAGAQLWISQDMQSRYRCFVVAPQCPLGSVWVNFHTKKPSKKLLLVPDLVEHLMRQYPIDADRIYLVGQSMGGYGVWALLEARPDLFAAGVPVAGGGDPSRAASISGIPVWAFHGARDHLVKVRESREMIAALEAAGGHPRYTEYPKLGHSMKFWRTVFSEPELPAWLFTQRRNRVPRMDTNGRR